MLYIDDNGLVKSNRITIKRFSKIERDPMDKVNGIIVHQTGTPAEHMSLTVTVMQAVMAPTS